MKSGFSQLESGIVSVVNLSLHGEAKSKRFSKVGRRLLVGLALMLSTATTAGAATINDLPDAVSGSPYNFQLHFLAVTPITATVTGGALPTGIRLDPSGLITGTPSIAGVQEYNFTVTVTDSSQPAQTLKLDYHIHGLAAAVTQSSLVDCSLRVTSVAPEITSYVIDGSKEITGTAIQPISPSGHTCSARVDLWLQLALFDPKAKDHSPNRDGIQVKTLLGTSAVTAGKFDIKLIDPLLTGQSIYAAEVITDTPQGSTTGTDQEPIFSDVIRVAAFGSWGLVKVYFTSGFLLSQDQGSFSQSSLFLAFTMDKTWKMPGYYFGKPKKGEDGKVMKDKDGNELQEPRLRWPPGINSFFETRLTSIPVTACAQASPTSGGSGGTSGTSSGCSTTTTGSTATSTTTLDTFLASRKTARLDVGVYLPFTMTGWTYHGTPNTLFLAPLAKLGFDTPAGALSQTQPLSTTTGVTTTSATVTPLNPTNFYNFYNFGGRFGHYAMTSSRDEAPETVSYLDFTFGRFSNLESFVQKGTQTDLRQRLWRISIEGILKVPSTPLIIGFNANVGMSNPNAKVVRRAGDDLRFLFGARFDVAKLLAKIGQVSP